MVRQLTVRNMLVSDIPSVVSIHNYAFHGFFLERMGSSFLTEYYSIVLEYNESIAIVAQDEQKKVNGFAVGFVRPAFFYAFLKSKAMRLIPSVLKGVIRSPSLLVSVFWNVLRIIKSSNIPININENTSRLCELSSIAVLAGEKGVGTVLLNEFAVKAWAMESLEIRLSTDADNNEKVHNFYLKNGFSLLEEEKRVNRKMSFYYMKK